MDSSDNIRRAMDLIARAAKEGCEFVALSECFTGKYGVSHFAKWREKITDEHGGSGMMARAAEAHQICVTGGIVEDDQGKLYNTMPAFSPSGSLLASYRKVHLSRVMGVTSESDVFEAGHSPVSFDLKDTWRVGMACCFDLRFPGFLRSYAPAADVLCAPSAFLHVTGCDHWELLLRRAALDGQCYVVAPNVAYDETDSAPLFGHSMIVDPWSRVLAQTTAEGDDLAIADLHRHVIDDTREKLPITRLARSLSSSS